MTSTAALTAAALLAGLSASPLGGLPAATGDVTWQAGHAVWNGEDGTYELTGDVVVRRGGVMLRAGQATVDPASGEVWASKDVLLVDATRVLSADTLHAVLDGPFDASDVAAFFKAGPLDPLRITTLAEARRGRNQLTLRADRVEGDASGRLRLSGIRFTPCDCGEGRAPSWDLRARRAEVEGDRVSLHWPVMRVSPTGARDDGQPRHLGYVDGLLDRQVPVLAVPWMSLPLSDRASGLLFPEFGRTGATGVQLGLPVYVTLGRSADLTLTPEHSFGPNRPDNPGGAVEGPGARLELRWAPADRAYGQVLLHLVDDRDEERVRSGARGGGGLRLSVEGLHGQDLGRATRLGARVSLSQDPFMFRDFHGAGLPSAAYYSRSDVLISRRADRWVLEGTAAYLQPLGPSQYDRPAAEYGWFGVRAPTLHRWPSAEAVLLPERAGPLQVQGRVGVSRWAPIVGHRGEILETDAGANAALFDPARIAAAAPREAVSRADARLQLGAPMLLGRTLSVEPFARAAVLGYAFDEGRDPAAAGWGVGGLSASLALARSYGALEHRIVPRVELLAGTATWLREGGVPFPAYDPWDRVQVSRPAVVQKVTAAPEGAYTQLRASLQNRLDAGKAGRLTLEVGQDVDVRRGELAESFAAVAGSKGPLAADASVRFLAFGGRPARNPAWRSSWLDEFTRLHLGASLRAPRGHALRASLDATGSGAVGAQGAGVDALFDLRPSTAAPEAWYHAGARVMLGAATLDYAVRLTAREVPSLQCGAGNVKENVKALRPVQQDVVLVWDSPCHCFTVRLNAGQDLCGSLTYGLSVDLSKVFQGGALQRPQ